VKKLRRWRSIKKKYNEREKIQKERTEEKEKYKKSFN
jgi:hypothetical protein